ncbi:MAG: DNA translocase FtsK 4TM domain-containing protein, partial [Verrucomicrobiota bacterium]
MARKPKKKTVKKIVSQPRRARSRPIWALLFFAMAILIFVAITDFDISQSKQHTTEPTTNLVGVIGAEFSFWTFHLLGVATFLIPVYLGWMGVRFLIQQEPRKRFLTALSALLSILCASGLAAVVQMTGTTRVEGSFFERQLSQGFGGVFGELLGLSVLGPYIGSFGSLFVLLIGLTIGSIVVFSDNLGRFLDYIQNAYRNFQTKRRESKEARKLEKAEKIEAKKLAKIEAQKAKDAEKAERAAMKLAKKQKKKEEVAETPDEKVDEEKEKPSLLKGPMSAPPGLKATKEKAASAERKKKKVKLLEDVPEPDPPTQPPKDQLRKPAVDVAAIKIVSGEKTEKAVASIPERRGDYVFPPLRLLAEAATVEDVSIEDHAQTMDALVRTLEEFSVKVIPGEIHTGPVITRYEVTPAPGVRVEKIVSLDKNIALGLKALSVRILAPVPGKGTVGIEVPNRISQAVCMRDIVESRAWADAKAEIPIVLGKDVTGKPIVADLTKMPHVLIAGSTGSGKTVCINAIIASLLYHSGPDDLRFIMVDPKVVEMQMYNSLPHMLIPVVTEPKKVPGALKWLLAEMEHRYQIFATENVRNIAGFNAKIAKTKEEEAKAAAMDAEMSPQERAAISEIQVPRDEDAFEVPRKKLPYIVVVIDELADLMMVAPADIETGIARLAQLARAAGIHLILATQRPSVNVITGV